MTTFNKDTKLVGFLYNVQLMDLEFNSISEDGKSVSVTMQTDEEPKVFDMHIEDVVNSKEEAFAEIIRRLEEFRKREETIMMEEPNSSCMKRECSDSKTIETQP